MVEDRDGVKQSYPRRDTKNDLRHTKAVGVDREDLPLIGQGEKMDTAGGKG